jgi:hypothetical protein
MAASAVATATLATSSTATERTARHVAARKQAERRSGSCPPARSSCSTCLHPSCGRGFSPRPRIRRQPDVWCLAFGANSKRSEWLAIPAMGSRILVRCGNFQRRLRSTSCGRRRRRLVLARQVLSGVDRSHSAFGVMFQARHKSMPQRNSILAESRPDSRKWGGRVGQNQPPAFWFSRTLYKVSQTGPQPKEGQSPVQSNLQVRGAPLRLPATMMPTEA